MKNISISKFDNINVNNDLISYYNYTILLAYKDNSISRIIKIELKPLVNEKDVANSIPA